jgi:hypothetical protein
LRTQLGALVRPADESALESALANAQSALGIDAFTALWAEALESQPEELLRIIRR